MEARFFKLAGSGVFLVTALCLWFLQESASPPAAAENEIALQGRDQNKSKSDAQAKEGAGFEVLPRGEAMEQLAPEKISQIEVQKLIIQLGDMSFRAREAATKGLCDIGVPALAALTRAESAEDLEIRQRATLLINRIRIANGLPTRVGGVEFDLITSGNEWTLGAFTPWIIIRLRITNRSDTVCRFYLGGTIHPSLRDPTGKELLGGCGQERDMATPDVTPDLAKDKSFDFTITGSLRGNDFSCQDNFSRYWDAKGLLKGTYQLSVVYGNNAQPVGKREPCWLGSAETPRKSIIVK